MAFFKLFVIRLTTKMDRLPNDKFVEIIIISCQKCPSNRQMVLTFICACIADRKSLYPESTRSPLCFTVHFSSMYFNIVCCEHRYQIEQIADTKNYCKPFESQYSFCCRLCFWSLRELAHLCIIYFDNGNVITPPLQYRLCKFPPHRICFEN